MNNQRRVNELLNAMTLSKNLGNLKNVLRRKLPRKMVHEFTPGRRTLVARGGLYNIGPATSTRPLPIKVMSKKPNKQTTIKKLSKEEKK